MDTQKSPLDLFLQQKSAAAGLTVKQLLADLESRAKARNNDDCLELQEVEHFEELPVARLRHVQTCAFCQVLVAGAVPNAEDAAAYAAHAVSLRQKGKLLHSSPETYSEDVHASHLTHQENVPALLK